VGVKLRECRQICLVVVMSFRVQCGERHDGTSNLCVLARSVHTAPSALHDALFHTCLLWCL
jgi:hypothetical protein